MEKEENKDNNDTIYLKKILKDKIITQDEFNYLYPIALRFNIIRLKKLFKILNKTDNKKIEYIYMNYIKKIILHDRNKIKLNTEYIIEKFKKKIKFDLTEDQYDASIDLIDFLVDETEYMYGLFGYAGTGKTTILVELLSFLVKNKFVNSIVFTAPTNKALNVIKSKIREYLIDINNCLSDSKIFDNSKNFEEIINILDNIGIKIEFMTVHKLLKFESELTDDGDLIFVRNTKKNLIYNFDIVIVDECSMIPIKMIDEILKDISLDKKFPKIIFAGDPAQLPPIAEHKSIIFIKDKKELPINKYICHLENNDSSTKVIVKDINKIENYLINKYKQRHDNIMENILKMKTITMKKVMRNRIGSVVELCYETRLLALNKIDKVNYSKCINKKGVYLFDSSIVFNKLESEWFKTFLMKIKNNKQSIIITWTNKQTETYNIAVRKMIFSGKKSINRFENGDILILSNTYDINETDDSSSYRLHTSEQIKVLKTSLINIKIEPFDENFFKKNEETIGLEECIKEYKKTVEYINDKINLTVRVWKLNISKISGDEVFEIFVLDEHYENKIKYDKDFSLNCIKKLKKTLCSRYKKIEKEITTNIINPFKKVWFNKFVKIFANVSYGYSITCHKSQGSDFNNVFIDVEDISKNNNINEMKQCLYTAVTRVSNKIYLLL